MATSKGTYANMCLPEQMLLGPLSLQQATLDLRLCRRPSNIHRQIWLSLLWGHCSFPLSPSFHKVVFVSSKSLFPPVLWKFCNHIPLPSKSDSWGIPSPIAGSPSWEARCEAQNGHNSGRLSLVLLFSSLWVTHLAGLGLDFIMSAPLLLSLLCLWKWVPASF